KLGKDLHVQGNTIIVPTAYYNELMEELKTVEVYENEFVHSLSDLGKDRFDSAYTKMRPEKFSYYRPVFGNGKPKQLIKTTYGSKKPNNSESIRNFKEFLGSFKDRRWYYNLLFLMKSAKDKEEVGGVEIDGKIILGSTVDEFFSEVGGDVDIRMEKIKKSKIQGKELRELWREINSYMDHVH
ncbi:MAG: hypothetical protein V3U72_02765, partial [Candidatus Aenigmarchaeota archaeon]